MIKIKNQEQLKRTIRALAETNDLIAKETGYSAATCSPIPGIRKIRNDAYLAQLKAHAEKLERAIKDFFPLPIIELNENSKRLLARALKGNP